jgi:hypothetical protein
MQMARGSEHPSSIRGRRIGSASDTANRRFAKDRVCADSGCSTVLSVYNPSEVCWQHETPRQYFLRVPRRRASEAA